MNTGRTVFSQIMDYLPLHEFRKCVKRYRGNYKVKSFSCLDQFFCMAFAQLTYRESLRDIDACLRSMQNKLYHMGIRGKVSRNTLAHANETRDWRIYADFAQVLIHQARKLYSDEDFGVELEDVVYALDSTTIDLCLSLFPWAHFRKRKATIKLHTLLDLRGSLPTFIRLTDGLVHDVNILDELIPETGCFYIMDRGYLDFDRLYILELFHAFFIIRAKSNLRFRRLYSHPVDKATGLRCDQTIVLTGINSSMNYPEKLRRVRFFDEEANKRLTFLTNNFILSSITIAQLYKCRWQTELFFRWIKQHLRIKSFYGTSENAVKTQMWIAVSVYLLVAIIKKHLNLDMSLYTFLQILSVTAFEKVSILGSSYKWIPELKKRGHHIKFLIGFSKQKRRNNDVPFGIVSMFRSSRLPPSSNLDMWRGNFFACRAQQETVRCLQELASDSKGLSLAKAAGVTRWPQTSVCHSEDATVFLPGLWPDSI